MTYERIDNMIVQNIQKRTIYNEKKNPKLKI